MPEKIKALKSWRASKASALGIDPGILCNNALITAIAVKNPGDIKSLETVKEMKNWQKKEFGQEDYVCFGIQKLDPLIYKKPVIFYNIYKMRIYR